MKKILLFILLSVFPLAAKAAVIPAIITSGTSLSSAVNVIPYVSIGGQHPVAVLMPATWTTASLIFLISTDSCSTFTELYDGNGNEYVVNAAASEYILLDPAVFGYVNCMEIQSVNYASPPSVPVNQGGTRTLQVIAQPIN